MGVVYEVRDRERGVRLALKGLKAPAAEGILRFKAEFRALRDLEHPNVLRLGELFEEDGRWFFTMELVEGCDFLAYVRGTGSGEELPSGSNGVGRSSPRARPRLPVHPSSVSLEETKVERRGGLRAPSDGSVRPRPSTRPGDGDVVYDEDRLRATLSQLTLALDALHRVGIVHRDVKPSNVLVEPGGRLVLLDFGVVADLGGHSIDGEGTIVGTASHMAPEQATGDRPGPAADWYAMGIMLYQALTGRLPFEGAMADLLARKVAGERFPMPIELVPSTSEELNALCLRLLETEAEARPTARDILRALGSAEPDAMLAPSRALQGGFVGRESELAVIAEAFTESRLHAVTLFVEGPSGIGKSATLGRALERFRATDPTLTVLRGRCHENETVPYNAFDGVLDDLSRVLRNLPEGHDVRVTRTSSLLHVFPALASVGWLAAHAQGEAPVDLGPVELRQRAFDELRALVSRVAADRPLIVVIDDAHWADAESLVLLSEWTRQPGAPKALLLATARRGADGAACAAIPAAGKEARVLALGGLSAQDARDLATRYADVGGTGSVESVLSESEGHPMFLQELLQLAADRRSGDGKGPALRLDEALLARADRLPEMALRTLEAVAVSGVPLREETLARALQIPRAALAQHLSVLRSARLVRSAGTRRENTVEAFHDRVREAVYHRLPGDRRRTLHRRLGELLEAGKGPHEVVLGHFDKAGDIARAVEHALAAAQVAAGTLAFERAATLYQYAVRSGALEPARELATQTQLGDAFQKAGKPREAAGAFVAAARAPGLDRDTVQELQRRACEQYLMGGYLDEGLEAMRVVLDGIGERRPDRYLLLVVLALWHLFQLKMARLTWTSRPEASLTAEQTRRLDVYWSLGAGLAFLDAMRSASFSLRGVRLAVRVGDDRRVARSAAMACMAASARGDGKLALRLIDVARLASERAGGGVAPAYVELARMGYEFMVRSDCRATLTHCERASALWSGVGQRGGWESDVIEQYALWSLVSLGELRKVVEGVEDGIRFARATGNRFREFMFRTSFAQRYILGDAPEEGDADVRDAGEVWAQPDGRFSSADYWTLKSRCLLAAYEGGVEKLRGLELEWARYDRSALGLVELMAVESSDLRATIAVRLAVEAKRLGDAAACAAHLARANALRKRIARSPLPFAVGMNARIRAASVLVERGFGAARPLYEASLAEHERRGFHGQSAAVHHVLSCFLGGDEGAAHGRAARAWVESFAPKNPQRALAMSVMGVTLLAP